MEDESKTVVSAPAEKKCRKKKVFPPLADQDRAGWRLDRWCAATSLSRACFYNLEGESAPASTTVGGRRIITESPKDWLQRIARIGGAPTKLTSPESSAAGRAP
jgi:hypothetical protein